MILNVYCCAFQYKTDMPTTVLAGRKFLPVNARYLMLLEVNRVVHHAIDA